MHVIGECFAVGTKIGVMAHRALVANTQDVRRCDPVPAERTIADDAVVDLTVAWWLSDGPVNGNKAMTGMVFRGAQNAVPAVVPIGASKTLVTNANNRLVPVELALVSRIKLT